MIRAIDDAHVEFLERMPSCYKPFMADLMNFAWACCVCWHKFQFSELRAHGPYLLCPNCGSHQVHPATGEVIVLDQNIDYPGPWH